MLNMQPIALFCIVNRMNSLHLQKTEWKNSNLYCSLKIQQTSAHTPSSFQLFYLLNQMTSKYSTSLKYTNFKWWIICEEFQSP